MVRWHYVVAICGVAALALFRLNLALTASPIAPPIDGGEIVVPYEPTPDIVVRTMLRIADVGPADRVIDLGSGDGRIVISAARDIGAQSLGVELDPRLVKLSRANAATAGVADRATFREEDIFKTDLSQATVITMFCIGGSICNCARAC